MERKVLFLSTLCLCLISYHAGQNDLAFLQSFEDDSLSFDYSRFDDLIGELENIFQNYQNGIMDFVLEECMNEVKALKLIGSKILESSGMDEIIFNTAKEVVDHFPGLKSECKLPLPSISTENWSLEKFRKYKCPLEFVTLATSFTTCVNGGIFACVKVLNSLRSVSKCVSDIFFDVKDLDILDQFDPWGDRL
jgi:hypothetical protein